MQVELGNPKPSLSGEAPDDSPFVTYVAIPDDVRDDGVPHYGYEVADSAEELARDVAQQQVAGGGVSHLPGQEAILAVAGLWATHGSAPPSWVWSDNKDFEKLLSKYFGCPQGRPNDVEDTHHTHSGPPGVGPSLEG